MYARTEPACQVGQGMGEQRRQREPRQGDEEEGQAQREEEEAAEPPEGLGGEGFASLARRKEGVHGGALVGPLGEFLWALGVVGVNGWARGWDGMGWDGDAGRTDLHLLGLGCGASAQRSLGDARPGALVGGG